MPASLGTKQDIIMGFWVISGLLIESADTGPD